MTAGSALSSPAVRRVLVVDDSVVARQVVARALGGDDGLELAGVAANGQIALDKLDRLRPDVVVLDLEMPVMDGFETLRTLRAQHPDLPVIVFSHLTERGASATLDAMALGATAFAAKPSAVASDLDTGRVRDELVPLIKALTAQAARPSQGAGAPSRRSAVSGARRASALVVAASTGGPNALASIVGALPSDLAVPVLVVQHMPAVFTRQLADRLDRLGTVPAVEATDGQPLVPGTIYIAPGGRHMGLVRRPSAVAVAIHDGPPENSCRPSADVLFRAAASVYGGELLGLVLTGMGRDGCCGAAAIRAAGGRVVVQDQSTAVVGSMPAAVEAAGLADAIVPLDRIGAELGQRLRRRPS